MDPQISFVVASIGLGLASVCVVLALWSFVRLSRVEVQVGELDTKLPPKRLKELEAAFDHMVNAFEAHQKKSQEWKQSVHSSVQRMDQIMRRNEKASVQLLEEDGSLNEDMVRAAPPELESMAADPVGVSKQEALRIRWRKNRGIN